MGFRLQQDVQVHTPADHLGRSFHEAALTKSKGVIKSESCDLTVGFKCPQCVNTAPHLNTFGTPSRLRSSPSFPKRFSTPFKISLGSTGPPAISVMYISKQFDTRSNRTQVYYTL